MRDYLFRGKRKDGGELVYGDLIYRQYSTKIGGYELTPPTWQDPCGDTIYIEHEVYKETIGMWSFLNDTKGNKIFAGDKLRGFQREQKDKEGKYGFEVIDTVVLTNGGFKVFGKCLQDGYTRDNNVLYQFMWCNSGHNNIPDYYYRIDDIEVIGSIHDVNQPAGGALNMNIDPKEGQPEEVKAPATETEQEQVPGEEAEG